MDLWEDACDMEQLLDEALYDEPTLDWARIYAIEDDLDDTYGEIDDIEDDMPPQEVISLASSLYREATEFQTWLGNSPLSAPMTRPILRIPRTGLASSTTKLATTNYLRLGTDPIRSYSRIGQIR